jgi:hypothetical protein
MLGLPALIDSAQAAVTGQSPEGFPVSQNQRERFFPLPARAFRSDRDTGSRIQPGRKGFLQVPDFPLIRAQPHSNCYPLLESSEQVGTEPVIPDTGYGRIKAVNLTECARSWVAR